MTGPLRTRYAPGYDLFKLIVAIILTIILIWLLLRENRRKFEQVSSLPTLTGAPTLQADALLAETPASEFTESIDSSTPTPTATQPAEPSPTELPPTESPTPVPLVVTPSPEPSPTIESNACPSNPTQIEVGDTVKTLDWLNFRIGPGLNFTIQHTNRPGTEMEVIGGPVCTLKGENPPRAYLWWNVRMGNGKEGWSAEAPLNFPNYFMEPVK